MNYKSIVKLFLCIVFIFGIYCGKANAAKPDSQKAKITGEPEALNILEQFRANENASQTISGSFVSEHYYQEMEEIFSHPDGSIEVTKKVGPFKTIVSTDWAIKGGLIRFTHEMVDENDVQKGYKFIVSWDGKRGTSYQPSKSYANIYGDKSKLLEEYSAEDPRGFSFFQYNINTEIDNAGGEFKVRREQSEEKEFVVLTQKTPIRTYEYWLDPANKYVPTKIIDSINENNRLLREVIINDYKILEDGSWFITESTINYTGLKREINFHTKEISFDEQSDDYFKIELPEGTLVNDTVTGNRYHAQPVIPSLVGKSLTEINSLSESEAEKFAMVWHPGGQEKQEDIPLAPGCFRVYNIELVPNPLNDLKNPLGSGVQYGRATFEDYGKTKYLCGVKKSSDRIVGYDEFFIDLNQNKQIEEDEIFEGEFKESRMGPDVIDCHYGPIDLTLHDKDGTRIHRVFAWYHMLNASEAGDFYFTTHCYMDGNIKLGDKEIHAILIDENCDGKYASGKPEIDRLGELVEGRNGYDYIAWDVDGDGAIERRDMNYIGGCTLFEDKAYRIDCSQDGKTVTVRELKVPMGYLQMPAKKAYVKLVGELGPTMINISDGNTVIPAGTYWVDYASITGPDEYGDIVTLTKSGRYFDKPWQIETGATTKIERETLVITSQDQQIFDDKLDALSPISDESEYESMLNNHLGNLEGLSIKYDSNAIKDKRVLMCFFDIEQRPSRNCIQELSKKAQELREKDIEIIAIHASKIEREYLDNWLKENSIDFPVGMIKDNDSSTSLGTGEKQARFNWGVKALPWLILTDKEHIVTAEGFSLDQLDEKI